MSIEPLPQDVVAQIKSSITITSLNGVLGELLKNALDAGSTKVDVAVDYSRGGCVVEDDGIGILPGEFGEIGGLGKLYHSSKWNSQTPVHGGRGIFLASLSAMGLVTITSHHHLHRSHNTAVLHKGDVISRQIPAPPQQHLTTFSHGTRVTVNDLFGNMPVRVKQRALSIDQRGTAKEWDELRHKIVQLLLPWSLNLTLTVREAASAGDQRMRVRAPSTQAATGRPGVPRICDILCQAGYITTEEKESWVAVDASTRHLEITGTISLEPSPVKAIQFLSFGIEPVSQLDGHSILHDEINRLFSNSAFGNIEEVVDLDEEERARRANDNRYKGDGFTSKELKGARKGVDRWPKFFIRIDFKQQESFGKHNRADVEDVMNSQRKTLNLVTELLQMMIWEFLTKHLFRPKHIGGRNSKPEFPRKGEKDSGATSKSPPRKNRSTKEAKEPLATKSILKQRKSSFDPLGTNVKLPSFRQGASTPDSPFDTWSRIKSGNPIPRSSIPKKASSLTGDIDPPIQRPFTAPPPGSVAPSGTSLSRRSKTPDLPIRKLTSKDGRIIRRPFEDVDQPRLRRTATISSTLTVQVAPIPTPTSDDGDDNASWMNPVTKVKSIVNTRTGHTIPAKKKSDTTSLRISSSNPRHSTLKGPPTQGTNPSPWIRDILKTWNNPIFQSTESSIPQVSFDGVDVPTRDILHGRRHHCSTLDIEKAFKEYSAGINGRISKAALRGAEVISQVDKKFILVKLPLDNGNLILVIIDQHAADERVRIETLLEELCAPPQAGIPTKSGVNTKVLNKPLIFEVSFKDAKLLKKYSEHFANWGVIYDVPTPSTMKAKTPNRLIVHSLPPAIIERCKLDPRLLIDLIRTEIYMLDPSPPPIPNSSSWLDRITSCPQGLLDMINSRACRSAIMFNDELSVEQCWELVGRLAGCKFPFQCAHGRPSLVPLVDLDGLVGGEERLWDESGSVAFGSSFWKWKEGIRG